MSVTAIIPARYGSTRLPGKPLLARTGKPLIQHVVEAVSRARILDKVVVATDDQRIFDAVAAFGGQAVMTRGDHACGTDRIAEAAEQLALADSDIVVNVQGDEPDMPSEWIEQLVARLMDSGCPMATLAVPLPSRLAAEPSKVKVVLNRMGQGLYFSRAAIPFDRDAAGSTGYLLHLGIYGYRVDFLKAFSHLPPTPAEQSEKLEQLRALESGYSIAVAVVSPRGDCQPSGIDTPQDYEAFVRRNIRQ